MRFQQFVEGFIDPIIHNRNDEVRAFAQDIRGGWEAWLQVEAFWEMRTSRRVGIASFVREPVYPGFSGKKADFKFTPANARGFTVWVELKAQRPTAVSIARPFVNDIKKLNQYFPRSDDATVGAIGVVPVPINGTRAALWELKGEIDGGGQYGTTASHVFYHDIGNQVHGNLAHTNNYPAGNGSLVVYWVRP